VETTAITDVMNGEIDLFIQAYLRQENQLVKALPKRGSGVRVRESDA